MKIVGLLQAYDFLLWERCFDHYCSLVDEMFVRFDSDNSPAPFKQKLLSHPKVVKTIQGHYTPPGQSRPYSWQWREELIRLLDPVRPDLVIFLDIDEMFEGDIRQEIDEFWKSGKQAMMFHYNPCPTETGIRTVVYPTRPHMVVYKWMPGLTYTGYKSYAQVTNFANPEVQWQAQTKIDHYCMWTKEMEEKKTKTANALYRGL